MPFEITPEPYVPPGTPVEPQNTSTFGITPEPYVPPGTPVEPPNTTAFAVDPSSTPTRPATPPSFIQWLAGGYPLGDADVLVINFVYPLIATRGVGEHENVITVRRAHPVSSTDIMDVPVPELIEGELIQPPSLYYTSILYPFISEDGMRVTVATPERSWLLTVDLDPMATTVPALQSGTLVATISFVTYDPRGIPGGPDTMATTVPALESGTLIVVISFVTYDARPFPDTMATTVPPLQSGTLVVTIAFVTYDNSLAHPDTMQLPVPALRSGTLT